MQIDMRCFICSISEEVIESPIMVALYADVFPVQRSNDATSGIRRQIKKIKNGK